MLTNKTKSVASPTLFVLDRQIILTNNYNYY